MHSPPPPDVVLLSVDRLTRAPLRAQLIEDGFEVIATDAWPAMRQHLRPGTRPVLVIIDLHDLPEPLQILNDVGVLMRPERIIVLMALGSVAIDAFERRGYVIVHRPASIGSIVETARAVRARASASRRERQ